MAVLVVEDELRVRAFLSRGLSEEGFVVRECANGAQARALLGSERFDLVVLDWMLPEVSGLELLRGLRAAEDVTPVVMLTARDALEDRLAALDAGADDYVVKPFAFSELVARVRAVLRRTVARPSPTLRCGDLVLDPSTRRVHRGPRALSLTAREFALLQFLMEHAGEVVTRTRIVQAVWEHDFETFSNVVEVYVRYLRTKLEAAGEPRVLHTVRGVGYQLRCDA
jgi:DNA-binding response OmpR family regulator